MIKPSNCWRFAKYTYKVFFARFHEVYHVSGAASVQPIQSDHGSRCAEAPVLPRLRSSAIPENQQRLELESERATTCWCHRWPVDVRQQSHWKTSKAQAKRYRHRGIAWRCRSVGRLHYSDVSTSRRWWRSAATTATARVSPTEVCWGSHSRFPSTCSDQRWSHKRYPSTTRVPQPWRKTSADVTNTCCDGERVGFVRRGRHVVSGEHASVKQTLLCLFSTPNMNLGPDWPQNNQLDCFSCSIDVAREAADSMVTSQCSDFNFLLMRTFWSCF